MAQPLSPLGLCCKLNAFVRLTLCYVLLIVLGGVVFTALEKPVEKELRAEVEELCRSFLQENPCVQEERLKELMGKALSAHRSDVAVLDSDAKERRSDFTSSLYFVIVTLTTMGKMQMVDDAATSPYFYYWLNSRSDSYVVGFFFTV